MPSSLSLVSMMAFHTWNVSSTNHSLVGCNFCNCLPHLFVHGCTWYFCTSSLSLQTQTKGQKILKQLLPGEITSQFLKAWTDCKHTKEAISDSGMRQRSSIFLLVLTNHSLKEWQNQFGSSWGVWVKRCFILDKQTFFYWMNLCVLLRF